MQVIVNPHNLELIKTIDVNSGEYNIQNVDFTFSQEYEDLTKIAIFSNEEEAFETIITNDSCIIPSAILETNGTIGLGVYAYQNNGDNLVKRYSPKPVFFNVELGSYQLAEESLDPSSDIISQILAQLEEQSQNIIQLQNNYSNLENEVNEINQIIPTLATKEEIPDVSNFITKDVDDLTNYTPTSELSSVALSGNYEDLTNKPDLSQYATTIQLQSETTNRENADIGLQGQIDAITSSSDVRDIVGTYQELQNYDTSTLGNDDIVKVLQDSTHNDAMTYYRWVITSGTGSWEYIGQEGPYYTKSEVDTTLQDYVEDSDLTNYVQKTDYATSSTGGVVKIDSQNFGLNVNNSGFIYSRYLSYSSYLNAQANFVIAKGTLENVITGKDLTTKTYVDGLVGDINTALDTINGEVI